jgi:hypothetical protein
VIQVPSSSAERSAEEHMSNNNVETGRSGTLRGLARVLTLPPARPGFIGEGHTAIHVIDVRDFAHKMIIEDALRASGGRVFGPTGAAARLGIPRSMH